MGGVVSVASKAGTNVRRTARASSSSATARWTPPTSSTSATRRRSRATSSAASRAGRSSRIGSSSSAGHERLQEDLGTTVITAVPTAAARTGPRQSSRQAVTSISIRCRTGPTLGRGSGSTRISSTARRGKTSRRARVDIQLSNKDSLFVRHTYDGSRQVAPVFSGAIQTTGLEPFFTEVGLRQPLLHGRSEGGR